MKSPLIVVKTQRKGWVAVELCCHCDCTLQVCEVWINEISLSPTSQKSDPAKGCSFVPAISECSLRSLKKQLVMSLRVLTPLVSPNQKTFKAVLVYCSCDPSPHPPSIFGSFSGSFASICSHPSGVPVTSLLFLAAFALVCLCYQFSSSHSPFVHHSFSPTQLKLVWILFGLNELMLNDLMGCSGSQLKGEGACDHVTEHVTSSPSFPHPPAASTPCCVPSQNFTS